MYCMNCGKQIDDDAKFCPYCGSQTALAEPKDSAPIQAETDAVPKVKVTASAPEKENQPVKSKKKIPILIGGVVVVLVAVVAVIFFGGDGGRDQAIQTVREGYLGAYTDVTVEEIVNYAFTMDIGGDGVVWDGGTTDDGEMIVEARYTDEGGTENQLQFRMLDEETFRYGGMTGLTDLQEAVEYLNSIYYVYYMEQVTDEEEADAVVDRLNQFSCGAVLCGASATYEGDRENLYQDAFDMEALPATAANYLGLLDIWSSSVDISGNWQDSWSQRCTMTIVDEGDSYYSVDITWSSDAWSYDEWVFSGYFDPETETLNYYNGNWYSYADDGTGSLQEGWVMDSMEGCLYLDGDTLYWDDYTSVSMGYDFGSSNMAFIRVG